MPKKTYQTIVILLILATTLPFLLLFKDLNQNFSWSKFALYLANILGFIGTSLLIWEFLLGVRFLVSLITPDLVWINKLHAAIGKYGMLLVFIHPLLEMYVYLENWAWLFVLDRSNEMAEHITFGRIAFILLILIYFTSAIARGKIKYRPWLYLHYLAYPLMFLTFVHALQIGTFLNQYLTLKALWFTMLALYSVLLVARLVYFSGIFTPSYKLIRKFKQTNNLTIFIFRPQNKKLIPKPGQYFYLQTANFGETHPFSVMEFNPSSGDLIFGIKILGKFTKKLDELQLESEIKIEGPYGVFTKEAQNNNPKVIIAGGIGVTPFVELVKNFSSGSTIFLHSNRNSQDIIERNLFKAKLGNRYIDFLSNDSAFLEPNVVNSRLNSKYLVEILGQNQVHNFNYFICGSPGFISGIKNMLKHLQISKNQIYCEEFSL